jgi:hypothetical protein
MDNTVTKLIYIFVAIGILILIYTTVQQYMKPPPPPPPPVKEGFEDFIIPELFEAAEQVAFLGIFIVKIILGMVMIAASFYYMMYIGAPLSLTVFIADMVETWVNLVAAIPLGVYEFGKDFEGGLKDLGQGFIDLGEIIEATFVDSMFIITDTVKNFSYLFEYIGKLFVYIVKFVFCAYMKMVTMPVCFFFYILEIIGFAIYMPILFAFFMINLLVGCSMDYILDGFWDFLYGIDEQIFGATGFYLFRFSPAVNAMCFNCDIDPLPQFPTLVFLGDYNALMDLMSTVLDKLNDTMFNSVIPAFIELITSLTKSVNYTLGSFATAFHGVKQGFKDARTILFFALDTTFGMLPDLWTM